MTIPTLHRTSSVFFSSFFLTSSQISWLSMDNSFSPRFISTVYVSCLCNPFLSSLCLHTRGSICKRTSIWHAHCRKSSSAEPSYSNLHGRLSDKEEMKSHECHEYWLVIQCLAQPINRLFSPHQRFRDFSRLSKLTMGSIAQPCFKAE